MLKRLLFIILFVGAVAVLANDGARYANEVKALRATTHELAQWAADNARTMSRIQVSTAVTSMGTQRGVTVYQYDQNEGGIRIWTRSEVENTVVLATVANMIEGMTFSEAREKPMTVRDYREAGTR